MRLIDADRFIKELNAGIFIYCQENTQDIIDAIQCQPTVEIPHNWYDNIPKALKARYGDYVLYQIDYLLDNLAREVHIMEKFRHMRGTKGYKRVQKGTDNVDKEV